MRRDRVGGRGWWAHLLAAASVPGALVPAIFGISLVAGPAGTSAADPLTECTTTTGVIVAVDLAPWGQDIQRGCAGTVTASTTGYQALVAAGFTPAGDEQDGPAFVCRIDGDPTVAQDPCVTTPPATAYWSFWYAPAGQDSWTYSQFGAMSFHPTAGSVNAWSFGAGSRPSFPPSAVWATTPGPTGGGSTTTTAPPAEPVSSPTTTVAGARPTGPTGARPVPPGATRPTATGSPASARSNPASSSPASTTTTTGHSTPTSTSTSTPGAVGAAGDGSSTRPPADPRIVDAGPVAVTSSAGSPLPLVIGAVVIAALAGTGGLIAWRRRRAG